MQSSVFSPELVFGLATPHRHGLHCCFAGSSLLGRAKQLGPHSFVQLSLFPANEQLEMLVPSLQTSFQAQTFCPEFHFRRQIPVDIDARMIQALATQVGKTLQTRESKNRRHSGGESKKPKNCPGAITLHHLPADHHTVKIMVLLVPSAPGKGSAYLDTARAAAQVGSHITIPLRGYFVSALLWFV